MKIKYFLLAIVLVLFISMTIVSASEINQTDILKDNVIDAEALSLNGEDNLSLNNDLEVLTASNGTYKDLRAEIGDGGDKILTKSLYKYNSSETTSITITKAGTIDGKGAIIDMAGSHIIALIINTPGVTIKNITFKNANVITPNANGGSLQFNDDGTVMNCMFINNTAPYGGAVHFEKTGSVIKSEFINNSANQGGAINFKGNGIVSDSYFIDNIAKTNAFNSGGGAIKFNANGTVRNSSFESNTANNRGGAVFIAGYGLVTNSEFEQNKAPDKKWGAGGAIYSLKGIINRCIFYENDAREFGGAIYGNNLTITNSIINNNTAVKGGAVYITTGIINNNTIRNNQAIGTDESPELWRGNYGGGVYLVNDGKISNNQFNNNYADKSGGAISGSNNLNVINNTITNNRAKFSGGAVGIRDGNAVITDNKFKNNRADNEHGGTVYIPHVGTIINNIFEQSFANVTGGAINMESGTVKDCIFNNTETNKGNGGAIWMVNGNITNSRFINCKGLSYGTVYMKNGNITNSSFINCRGTVYGAVYINTTGNVNNCNFNNNQANLGGAILIQKGNIKNSNFTNNTAINGGAVYIQTNGNVNNCNFNNNRANFGGAILIQKGNIKNSNFTNNTATSGGAVYMVTAGPIDNCNFINNTAKESGGAVHFNQSSNVTNSKFSLNSAILGGAIYFNQNGLVTNSDFRENKASLNGGAINFQKIGTVNKSNFTRNSALNTGKIVSSGGAIHFTQTGSVNNSNFKLNGAVLSGAITFLEKGTVTNSNFTQNIAQQGGAINFLKSGEVTKSNFNKNSATKYNGGAILFNQSGTVTNSKFSQNTAEGNGGAVYMTTSGGKIRNSNFTGNKALGTNSRGGAVMLYNQGSIDKCNFEKNSAGFDGGAVIITAKGDISNSKFTQNTAFQGSAIKIQEGNITNTVVLNNRADSTNIDITYHDNMIDLRFFGKDNMLNGIYAANQITVKNITYWGANGIMNSGNEDIKSNLAEAGQNITIIAYANNKLVVNTTKVTGKDGEIIIDAIPGTYNITAEHISDSYYTQTKTNKIFNIPGKNTTINLTINDMTAIAEISKGATGNITFTVENESGIVISEEVKISNDTAELDLYELNLGNYTITASYSGDNKFLPVENNTEFSIEKEKADMKVSSKNNVITVELPKDAKGNVTATIVGKTFTAPVKNGKATINTNLNPGKYIGEVKYSGDDKYNPNVKSIKLNIPKIDPEMDVNLQDNEIIVELPEDATGNVNTIINGKRESCEVISGIAIIPLYDLKPGNYTLNIKYTGDNKYLPDNETVTVELFKETPEMTVSTKNNIINVVLPNDVTGNVTVNVDGKEFTAPVKNGKVTITITGLEPGKYTANIKYSGNDYYYPRNEKTSITIPKIDPKMNASFEINEIIIELPEDATGNVTTVINGTEHSSPVVDGLAIIPLYDVKPGNYTLDIKYSGDDKYFEDNAKVNAEIYKETPEMTVSVKDNVINVVLPNDVTGNVTVNVDGKEFTAPVKNGKATITITGLEPGKYTANIKYSGNDYYYPRNEKTSITIPKINPEMNVNVEDNEVIAELPEDATGNVTTVINGTEHSSPVVDGLAIIPLYDVKPGNYTLDIKYSGDDKYFEDNAKVNAEIYKETPEMTVSTKNNIINVVLPNDVTGNVTVNVDGKEFTAPVKNGKATITVTGLEPGKYTANIKYSGNDQYYPRTEKTDVTIPKIAPEMKVHKNNDEIIVELPEDATGNVVLEVAGEKLTTPVENGQAEFSLDKISSGEHEVKLTYSGDDKYKSVKASEKINIDGIELVADDVIKYYSGSERLVVTLLNNDKPIKSKEIKITLNGVTYTRITDDKGQASLGINLVSGNYTALVETEEYSISTLVDIEVKPTVYSNDLVKMFRNATQYYALFLDSKGNPLANTDVEFNIHGVLYTRTTNATGWAKLNINLEEGKYVITATNLVTGESKGYTVTVLSLIESSDLTKYYKNASQFVVRVHSVDGGWAKEGEEVLFNINGVFYVRITNETGHVKLNINLNPGEYIITADCKGCYKSNYILVLPTLTAEDLNMKYKDGSKFTAKVVDGQGKPYPNQNVTFNVHGVIYTRITDANGEAKLNINLMAGEYIITSGYNGAYISNKITISS